MCSSDNGAAGRTALLHRTFVVPANAAEVRFRAAAFRPKGVGPGRALDVVLEASGREFIPRQVRTPQGWVSAPTLLPPRDGQLREYAWDVSGHAGRAVRIALVDQDARPGCYLVCAGFRVVSADIQNVRAFREDARRLRQKHGLRPLVHYLSEHFVAMANAPEGLVEQRLDNCETIHSLFFDHFRRRGFAVREPAARMMVMVFDTQAGMEAYLGRPLSPAITGLYHLASNRLLVYDYASNKAFRAMKKQSDSLVKKAGSDLERERLITLVGRHFHDRQNDVNISTMMHETAHQLSFNCGLLNRKGDAPAWVVEGLACYCEPTLKGSWQGLGAPNPQRVGALKAVVNRRGKFIPLRALVASDDWLRKATRTNDVLLGYSQSWALFRMLMDERPGQLRRYLRTIYTRRTPKHRLADFAACFGRDLAALERRYQAYLRQVVWREAP